MYIDDISISPAFDAYEDPAFYTPPNIAIWGTTFSQNPYQASQPEFTQHHDYLAYPLVRETFSQEPEQALQLPFTQRHTFTEPTSDILVTSQSDREGLTIEPNDHLISGFPYFVPNQTRRTQSDSGETYQTSVMSLCPHTGHFSNRA